MTDHIHALRRGLDSIEDALKRAGMERKKSTNNQQGMPAHLYQVSQMYATIGRRLGVSGLEGQFHALKSSVDALAAEALDESREWEAQLEGRSRSRSRSRRNRSRRSRSVA
jgi:hypothetical protein